MTLRLHLMVSPTENCYPQACQMAEVRSWASAGHGWAGSSHSGMEQQAALGGMATLPLPALPRSSQELLLGFWKIAQLFV